MWGVLGQVLQPALGLACAVPAIRYAPEPVALPVGLPPMPASSQQQIDEAMNSLNKTRWVKTPIKERVQLLDRCMWNVIGKAKEFAELSVKAKGSYGQGLGEELLCILPVVISFKDYVFALREGGQRKPLSIRKAPGTDQLVAKVTSMGISYWDVPSFVDRPHRRGLD